MDQMNERMNQILAEDDQSMCEAATETQTSSAEPEINDKSNNEPVMELEGSDKSEESAEPEKPTELEESAEPEKLTESEESVEPEKLTESEEPAEPEKPTESEEPAESEKPSEPEDPVKPEIPENRNFCKMAMYRDGLTAFGVFQQGSSHIKKGTPCQDYGAMRMLKNGLISVTAIADGVGSCEMSHFGSTAAVQAALKTVCERLQPLAEDPSFVFENDVLMKEVMTQAFEAALDAVEEKADEMDRLPYSYQSTLTLAIYNGKTLYFAHAGDDGIVALCQDGTCQMVTMRHKGEAANSVFPLQSGNWQFGKADREVVGFVMMTDGVLDQVVGSTLYENRVYYPFFQPIFEAKISDLHEAQECGNEISQYLQSSAYRERVKDDITLVAVLNQNTIHNSQKPAWDANKWEEQTQKVNRKVNERLYPDENKTQKSQAPVKSETPRPVQKQHQNREEEPARTPSSKPDDQQLSGKFPAHLYNSGRIKTVTRVYREETTRDGRIQQFFIDAKERLVQPAEEILDIMFREKRK